MVRARRSEIREVMPWDRSGHFDTRADLGRNSMLMEKQLEQISPKMAPDERMAALISKLQTEKQELLDKAKEMIAISKELSQRVEELERENRELRGK